MGERVCAHLALAVITDSCLQCQVYELQADLAQARQERNRLMDAIWKYRNSDTTIADLEIICDDLNDARKERDTLKAALQTYGQHSWKCAALAHPIAVGEFAIAKSEKAIERSVKKLQKLEYRHLSCTCGLTAALGGTDG